MADRAKRFKACKIRVHSQSTRGKKTTKSIRVKVSTYNGKKTNDTGTSASCMRTDNNQFNQGQEFEIEADVEKTNEGELSKHHQRRRKEFNSWEAIRESMLKARIEEEAFSNPTCVTCSVPALCRCVDCGPRQFFCMDCAKILHNDRNHFHNLEIQKGGCFVPLMVNHSVLSLHHQASCPSSQCRTITCIDQHGYQHKKSILFCCCEDDAITLIKLQLWPGSITRPVVAFHFKLMMLAELFLLECHVSLRKFCDVLGLSKSSLLPKWIQNLYKVLNSDTFDEFRYHQYLFKTRFEHSTLNECPLCPKNESGILIHSMDGCFGLVRKKSAGANLCPPRHRNTFFADQDDVDNFVEDYGKKAKDAPTDCNDFKSGEVNDMLRSKGRNKLLDEKGVFGSVCRHEYPKGFMSIKHGERIAYSVYEVQRLLNVCDDKIDVKIMYDIGCTLSSHLKKNDRHDMLKRISLAIPVFHCYGHKSSCQTSFSPRRNKGYGLTDGEGIERLWSYLRGFSSMTKEMTSGRRVDILTDALIHYAEHRIKQFGPALVMKIKKTRKLMENAMSQLQEIFSKLTVSYDADLVCCWIMEEECILQLREKRKVLPLSWEAKYVQNLCNVQELRSSIALTNQENHNAITDVVRKIKSILKAIATTERNRKIENRWKVGEEKFNAAALSIEHERRNRTTASLYHLAAERIFLISLKRKYADGQAIAVKLSKQITQKTNAIKVAIAKYNTALAVWKDQVEGLPATINFDEMKDPESPSTSTSEELLICKTKYLSP